MEKSKFEIALANTKTAIKGTKIVEQENSTGISFFEGKKRLCKILKSKNSLSIEINVTLDAETETKFNLTRITAKVAHQKHLGTMKYMARIGDPKELPELLKSMVASFKAEQIAEKAQQDAAANQ